MFESMTTYLKSQVSPRHENIPKSQFSPRHEKIPNMQNQYNQNTKNHEKEGQQAGYGISEYGAGPFVSQAHYQSEGVKFKGNNYDQPKRVNQYERMNTAEKQVFTHQAHGQS